MYRLLAFAVALCLSQSAYALSCKQPEPQWWPGAATIAPNPFIVLSKERLKTAWFQAGKERIAATVTVVDQHRVIRPAKPLTVGRTYTLGGTGEYGFAKGPWQGSQNSQQPLTWTVRARSHPAPVWTGEIGVGASSGRYSGWGPTSSQILNLPFESAGPAIAEVKLVRGKSQRLLLLPVLPGKPLRFGRGLCSGEIDLLGDGDWTARITLIGASGQRSEAKTVVFPSPKATGLPRPQ